MASRSAISPTMARLWPMKLVPGLQVRNGTTVIPAKLKIPQPVLTGGKVCLNENRSTGVGIRHDLGMDLNYRAYMEGGPLAGGPGGPPEIGRVKQTEGGPYRPAEFAEHRSEGGPPDGGPGGRKHDGPPPGWAAHLSEDLLQEWQFTNRKDWSR